MKRLMPPKVVSNRFEFRLFLAEVKRPSCCIFLSILFASSSFCGRHAGCCLARGFRTLYNFFSRILCYCFLWYTVEKRRRDEKRKIIRRLRTGSLSIYTFCLHCFIWLQLTCQERERLASPSRLYVGGTRAPFFCSFLMGRDQQSGIDLAVTKATELSNRCAHSSYSSSFKRVGGRRRRKCLMWTDEGKQFKTSSCRSACHVTDPLRLYNNNNKGNKTKKKKKKRG